MKDYHISSNNLLIRRLLHERNNFDLSSDSDDDSSTISDDFIIKREGSTVGLSFIDQLRESKCSSKGTSSSTGEFSDASSEQYGESIQSDRQNIKSVNKFVKQRSPASEVSSVNSLQRKKKKKKRKVISICTSNCRYEIVRQVAFRFGMKDVSEDDTWDLYWTDMSVSSERVKEMKRFQKINHFPGMGEISRKDLLARNLNRMLRMFPTEYNFFPRTWCLPADYSSMTTYARKHKNRTYICKPEVGSQGRGILITKNVKDIRPYERMICQLYISKPFLVDGFKFDLRIYVLITSCDPLRIFIYNDGLARFATSRYQEPSPVNVTNVFMHLTNYAVNKHSRMFIRDSEAGSKRKISTLNKWLEDNSYNVMEIWSSIDEVIVKTVIAAHPIVKHNYHTCFPSHDFTYACFELLGFDILLDNKLKPYLLEVNHSPSFHTETQIDREIKEDLLTDTFRILNLAQTDKKKIMEEDRRRIRERLLQGIFQKDCNNLSTSGIKSSSPWDIQKEWEDSHMGNYRRAYPTDNSDKYDLFFYQNQSSLYQNTAASRAREECARIQREEQEGKVREETLKRVSHKVIKDPYPESPSSKEINTRTIKRLKPALRYKQMFKTSLNVKNHGNEGYVLNSFTAQSIVEKEEAERKLGLLKRDVLIRNNNVKNVVEQVMIRNGALSKNSLMRYGLYSKLRDIEQPENRKVTTVTLQPQLMLMNQFSNLKQISSVCQVQGIEEKLPVNITKSPPSIVSLEVIEGLKVTCNHAPVEIRPSISGLLEKTDRFRDTKTQVVRSFINNTKRKNLERRDQNPFYSIR